MANATTASYRTLKPGSENGRVLIASDSVGEAAQLVGLLGPHMRDIQTSVQPERAVADFEAFKPDVIVLAFDTLEKAQNYYLGLHRESSILPAHPHRTVVLCTKDEVREAFDLCVKRCFDDYVLYWPLVQDGLRLPMSVTIACREIKAPSVPSPQRAEWLAQAKPAGTSERTPPHAVATPQDRVALVPEPARAVRAIIMVVDDDEFSQELVARALAAHPYQLLFASDGATAFRELEQVRPDAIFMDFRLPGVDGVALTRRLKASKQFASIPIIMLTGDARSDTLMGSIQAGAAAFVVKPFTNEALLSKLEQVLAS